MPSLTLQLFGSPQIIYEQGWIDLRSAKACALLYYLAVTQRAHSRLALAGLLWPDKSDVDARTNLRQAIHHLHLAIPACLFATRDSVSLNRQLNVVVDVLRFDELATLGLRSQSSEPSHNALRSAVSLYQGEFLAGFFVDAAEPFEEWVSARRERLNGMVGEALRQLVERSLARGDTFEGQHYAQQLVSLEPLNEAAHYQLMQLLAMHGQTQAALTQYARYTALLADELDTQPGGELAQLAHDIRLGLSAPPMLAVPTQNIATAAASTLPTKTPPHHNLSAPLSSFVGRGREITALEQMLTTPGERLVTLLGPGGVGKTRLAVEIGHRLLPLFVDGVWFFDLLTVGDETMVAQSVVGTMGIHETGKQPLVDRLIAYLVDRQTLLLIDNCEHVLGGVARLIETLLQAAPRLTIVTTSREPLNIPGERCFTVAPLALPDKTSDVAVQALLAPESAQLFVQRASSHATPLQPTEDNARHIAQICRMLDGIPLAIELAAAHARSLSLAQIVHQLEDVPGAYFQLTSRGPRNAHERHQTLYRSIDWSYKLLSAKDRRLFARLAVFAGSWSLEAVQRVCGDFDGAAHDEPSILEQLTGLVDKSLVIAEPNGDEMRYHFLETIQRFAQDKLAQSGDEDALRDGHLRYFVDFMTRWEVPPAGMSRAAWQSKIAPDLDNVRSALNWCLQRGLAQPGLRLAQVTGEFWFSQGLHSEIDLLDRVFVGDAGGGSGETTAAGAAQRPWNSHSGGCWETMSAPTSYNSKPWRWPKIWATPIGSKKR
ncbi:MAG: BTAD domain-containing putative transcriptional regulator [Caldilineaceae bacterium]